MPATQDIGLQAYKNVYLASLYSLWWWLQSWNETNHQPHLEEVNSSRWYGNLTIWCLLFYSALGPGTLADIWQQHGQVFVNATESNVWLSLEPVFTAVLGFVCLHEQLSYAEMGGGVLVVGAALLAST